MLTDLDQVLDIDNRRPVEPLVGWDGFMAIGILSWRPHTYRHELESLFYVFLWPSMGNGHWERPRPRQCLGQLQDLTKNIPAPEMGLDGFLCCCAGKDG